MVTEPGRRYAPAAGSIATEKMALRGGSFFTVPGWNGSGRDHWQSRWEAAHPGLQRIAQRDWVHPIRAEWTEAIDRAIREAARPIFLIAHSLGCIAVAHWALGGSGAVDGALLVAPPLLGDSGSCPKELVTFLPMPLGPLPFRSILVASENDPYMQLPAAERLARSWGSELVNMGQAGHINVASGHGPWPAGEELLERMLVEFQGGNGGASRRSQPDATTRNRV